tara:strand:+ start:645 stop:1538 length:894 start_codon:yes stop_codon:yes gene_type:complete
MLTPEQNKNLLKELSEHKKDISELKSKLSEINVQKESWFKKKENYNKQISELIKTIKSNRNVRDNFTKRIKQDKVKRTDLGKGVTQRLNKIKQLNDEKRDLLKKYEIKGNPLELKSQIDELEHKMETEVHSIEQEKKLMKTIKDLKKKFKEIKSLVKVWEQSKILSKEMRDLKRERDKVHNNIQTQAKQGQEKHVLIMESSKEIDGLKEKEGKAFQEFLKFKKEFIELNNKLKQELNKISKINIKLSSDRNEIKKIEKKKQAEVMKTKEENVKDKIKRGKKLTTEDLLVMQKNNVDI